MAVSTPKERLIERLLEGNRAEQSRAEIVIPKRPFGGDACVPMSLSQEQIWKRSLRAAEDRLFYNENITIRGNGPTDLAALQRAFTEVVRRHEVWRTSFELRDGEAVQIVHAAPDTIEIPAVDLRSVPNESREEHALRLISEWIEEPLGLTGEASVRPKLLKLDDTRYRFIVIVHQGVVDGVSAYQIFPLELAALYDEFHADEPSSLPDLPIQFGDFSIWQRDWLGGNSGEEQLTYWKKRLAAPLADLRWPRVKPGRRPETCVGTILPFEVPHDAFESAGYLARREGASMFAVLLSGFATLMHRYTQQDDIVIATLSPAGRKRTECPNLLGHFLNPVTLRFDFSAKPGFRELLSQTRRILGEAISHDDVPFESVEQALGLERNRGSFVRTAISLQPKSPEFENGWRVTTMDARLSGSRWDFYLAFIQREGEMEGRVQYNPALFEEREITATLEELFCVLQAAANGTQAGSQELFAVPNSFV